MANGLLPCRHPNPNLPLLAAPRVIPTEAGGEAGAALGTGDVEVAAARAIGDEGDSSFCFFQN